MPGDETTEILNDAGEAPARPPSGSLIGRTLGKFTLVQELGRGGSGEVYEAQEVQLGRSVVVKVLRRDVVREGNRAERFLREVKLASRLDHPYAAHVYAFGAERDNVVWIAMEHVRGITLDALVAARGPMPAVLFGPLFARLCEVVHTAHELGIVHRDIKGSNVMVIERAGQMLPKLLDFGIAKGIAGAVSPSAAAGGSDDLTGHGAILGSPHYMAPEQWESAADVDARADIYALGVLAYFCVGGRLPYAGTSRHDLPKAHRELPPPALPASVPAPLAAAISRALQKSPEARWPDALAFAAAVHAAIGGGAPETVPLLDAATRDLWAQRGPQPVADAIVRLARAATTVEADAALDELIAIACRWLAVVALARMPTEPADPRVRELARALVGREDAAPWLRLARAAATVVEPPHPGLAPALAGSSALEQLALRRDDRERSRTAAALAIDIAAVPEALAPLAPLLDYHLVVGRAGSAESWQGARRRDRDPIVVWGEPLKDGDVALLDREQRVSIKLSPLVQVSSPLPSAEPELFLLWRTARGAARLVAAPWGYERDDEAAAHWLAALTTSNDDTLIEADDEGSPYPGLAAYDTSDAANFVGREREIEALVNRLVAAPLIAVLGASGAGKTSFIHAGVIPRLAESYDIISLRPGRHPLRTLEALTQLDDDDKTSDVGEGPVAQDRALVARLRARGERATRGLVIVVDQLEEIVTLCSDTVERDRFASVLTRAASDRDAPVRVLAGLRDDFANVIETLDAFRLRFETYVLATPAADALRRIITEPARRAQVQVDEQIVTDMLAQVVGRAGSLPLLSFTAAQLWETRERDKRRITHDAYVAIGGLAGALSAYADEVYGSLGRADQETVRNLFARLVAPNGTRVPIPRAELEELPGAKSVIARLVDARLLVVRDDSGVDVVEIIHEALATRWDRLVRWRNDDAASRLILGDVRTAARRWVDSGHSPDLLWRGEALDQLRRLRERAHGLTEVERAFASASDRAAQRSRRIRRGAIAGTMVALVAVAGSMTYLRSTADRNRSAAEQSAEQARTAARLADERLTASLIAQGRRELNDGRGLAALAYFGEAIRRGADTPGLRFMIGVARRGWADETFVRQPAGTTATIVTPKGFAAADQQGKVRFWSDAAEPLGEVAVELGPITKLLRQGNDVIALAARGVAVVDIDARSVRHRITLEQPTDAQLGPDANELVAVVDRAIVVHGLDGTLRRRLEIADVGHAPELVSGGTHAWFGAQGTMHVLDTRTMQRRALAGVVQYGPYMCHERTTVVALSAERKIFVLDAKTGALVREVRPTNDPLYVTCSPSGDRIGAVSTSGIEVYDRAGTLLRNVGLVSSGEAGVVRLLGDDVWTGSLEGVMRRYHKNVLVASLPSLTGRLVEMKISDRHVIGRMDDSSFVVVREQADHLKLAGTPCQSTSLMIAGSAVGVICGEDQHVYIGRSLVGTVKGAELGYATLDAASGRGAIAVRKLSVFEAGGGKLLAESDAHLGAIAFEDKERLLVAEAAAPTGATAPGLWRWTFATNRWERVTDLEPGVTAITVAAGTIWLGTETGKLVAIAGTTARPAIELGTAVDSLARSSDNKRLAVQLSTGATKLFDADGRAIRELEPTDANRVSEALDATGALISRPRRGMPTIWDTATGDLLLYELDLFRYAIATRFAADGSLEFAGSEVGTIAIAPDQRPTAEILRELECRVPLRVDGTRLAARATTCGDLRR